MSEIEVKDRQFVNALARGLEILRVFRPGDGALSNQDISDRTGLPKPTVSRLTSTLRELAYLEDDEKTGGYALGPGVLALGYSVLASMDVYERAAPFLEKLAEKTDGAAMLTVLADGVDTLLAYRRSGAPVHVNLAVGMRFPLASSACGLSIMAAHGENARARIMSEFERDLTTPEYGAVHDSVSRATAEYAEHGFCSALGAWNSDVLMVGAPVYWGGAGMFGLGVVAPAGSQETEAWRRRCGAVVREVAAEMSAPT